MDVTRKIFWLSALIICATLFSLSCGSAHGNGDDDAVDDDTSDDDTTDDDSQDDDAVEYEYSIKVDDMPMADVLQYVDALAERGFTLYLNTRPYDIGSDDLAAVIERADELGLKVKLWPLLNGTDGSWCNEDNLDLFINNVIATVNYVETIADVVDTVVINVELGHPKIDLIRQYFADGNYAGIVEILLGNRNPDMFEQSVAKLQELIDELHGRGYLVQATTYPFILDDFEDGDSDLQDIANAPISGITWDIFAFTPYSTSYSDDLGVTIGPYFPYSYAKSAHEMFGDAAEIAVGIVDVSTEPGYESPEQLAADVAAAKAAGIKRIDVYHLLGMVENDNFDEWADALLVEPKEPEKETTTDIMRLFIDFADTILNTMND